MTGLKKLFWTLRAELKSLVMGVANGKPGLLGQSVRRAVYRRFLKRLGKDTVFQSGLRITNPEFVAIGSNCNFAQRVFITGGGGIDQFGQRVDNRQTLSSIDLSETNQQYADGLGVGQSIETGVDILMPCVGSSGSGEAVSSTVTFTAVPGAPTP